MPRPPCPRPPPLVLQGGYRGVPRPVVRHSPSNVSKVSSCLDMPQTPHWGGVQEVSVIMDSSGSVITSEKETASLLTAAVQTSPRSPPHPLTPVMYAAVVSAQDVKYFLKGQDIHLMPSISEPPTQILWQHNGIDVVYFTGMKNYVQSSYKKRITLDRVSAELTIKNATYEDSGVYHLEMNINSEQDTFQYRIEVIDKVSKPDISCERSDTKQATLVCSAESKHPHLLKFKWSSPGKEQTRPNLTITVRNKVDGQVYRCDVSNPLTKETASFTAMDCFPGEISILLQTFILLCILTEAIIWCCVLYTTYQHLKGNRSDAPRSSLLHVPWMFMQLCNNIAVSAWCCFLDIIHPCSIGKISDDDPWLLRLFSIFILVINTCRLLYTIHQHLKGNRPPAVLIRLLCTFIQVIIWCYVLYRTYQHSTGKIPDTLLNFIIVCSFILVINMCCVLYITYQHLKACFKYIWNRRPRAKKDDSVSTQLNGNTPTLPSKEKLNKQQKPEEMLDSDMNTTTLLEDSRKDQQVYGGENVKHEDDLLSQATPINWRVEVIRTSDTGSLNHVTMTKVPSSTSLKEENIHE
ncbi:uncharacterized protein LOC133642556 [Entelurus aequoreus]|uniref:uncharacterized protein LOC133642556 n=1 Tax=Entelurus aequoreus TaxID=161455 RepID=UPI002B1CF3C8|nr:uncharacterized protein LOC133642556 [Entelurus aequoreus]